jgi:hypothetical protein
VAAALFVVLAIIVQLARGRRLRLASAVPARVVAPRS